MRRFLAVVLTAYGLLAVVLAVYFLFLKDKDTGTNADEARTEAETKA